VTESTPTQATDGMRERICADLRAEIAAGKLAPGAVVPSGRALAARYGCSNNTARTALGQLSEEGLITVLQGRPTVVRGPARKAPAGANAKLLAELVSVSAQVTETQQKLETLANRRRQLVDKLHANGMSYAQIGAEIGLTRSRAHQIHEGG